MLDTGRERGVEVELNVRVLGDDGVVDVGHKAMEMKRRDGGEPVLVLDRAPYVLKDCSGERWGSRGT